MRNYKIKICISCGNEKKIQSKGFCQACYSKNHRNTDKGKEYLINYNKTKGVEAAKRYRLKNKKQPKVKYEKICSCGKKAIAKGLCRNCYQNNRNVNIDNKPYTKNIRLKLKKERNSGIDIKLFERLLDLVKDGIPLYKAVLYEGISRNYFRRNATPLQKIEIKFSKKLKL